MDLRAGVFASEIHRQRGNGLKGFQRAPVRIEQVGRHAAPLLIVPVNHVQRGMVAIMPRSRIRGLFHAGRIVRGQLAGALVEPELADHVRLGHVGHEGEPVRRVGLDVVGAPGRLPPVHGRRLDDAAGADGVDARHGVPIGRGKEISAGVVQGHVRRIPLERRGAQQRYSARRPVQAVGLHRGLAAQSGVQALEAGIHDLRHHAGARGDVLPESQIAGIRVHFVYGDLALSGDRKVHVKGHPAPLPPRSSWAGPRL